MHWTSVWAFRLGVRSLTFSFFSSWCFPCVFLCVASFLLFFLCGWGDGVEDGEGGGIVEGGGEGGPPAPTLPLAKPAPLLHKGRSGGAPTRVSSGEGTLPPPNDLGWWVGWLGPGLRCGFVLWLSSCSRFSVVCRLSVSVLLFSQTLLRLIPATDLISSRRLELGFLFFPRFPGVSRVPFSITQKFSFRFVLTLLSPALVVWCPSSLLL